MDPADLDSFRRQFAIGPHPAGFPGWRVRRFGEHSVVSVHPGLPCEEIGDHGRQLICLGDLLSLDEPHFDNHRVLQVLFESFSDFESLERAAAPLGGRWVLLARQATQHRAYPDATGGRPIFHCSGMGGTWAGSLPATLAHILGLQPDGQTISAFTRYTRDDWWPGTLTPYQEVKHALPNHYLDLNTGATVRFWPRQPIAPVGVDDAAAEIGRLLLGILAAASHRYEVHLAVTGGLDSRVLAAVTRPIHHRVRFFTLAYPGIDSFDLTIPRRLARRCGLRYVCEAYDPPSEEFLERFDALASHMVSGQCRLNAFSYRRFPPRAAFAEGTGAELLRSHYAPARPGAPEVSATELAARSGFAGHPLAEAEFGRWMSGVPGGLGMSGWDLFYWEQRMGNWNANDYATQELTRVVFTPFNCRRLLETGLGTPGAARRAPYPLLRTVCQQAYPEVLRERINSAFLASVRRVARRAIATTRSLLGGTS